MFPLSKVFDWYQWMGGYQAFHKYAGSECESFGLFMEEILRRFQDYQVPVIALDVSTSKEAVCTVFEKVNTGGKPLDAFELVTAMYAADGHELRRDWSARKKRLENVLRLADSAKGILADVSSTDFLQVVSLFYTRERRRELEASGRTGRDLPPVTGTQEALLNLPLTAYKKYEAQVESGFQAAAEFLHRLHIYRPFDLPYQSQLIPLAAILAERNDALEDHAAREKLVRWYWNGVFGELYGSAVEIRSARDFLEVTAWLDGGAEPTTISETVFRSDRLKTMRMRVSAAYKGVNALLMSQGAKDFRSGQEYSYAVFFNQAVDILHIFPKKWCEGQHIKPEEYDSIINKTPLSSKTNRKLEAQLLPSTCCDWSRVGKEPQTQQKSWMRPCELTSSTRSPAIGQLPCLYGGPATRLTLVDRAGDWEGGVCRSGRRGRYGPTVWRGRGGRVTYQPACAIGSRKRFHARGRIARSNT